MNPMRNVILDNLKNNVFLVLKHVRKITNLTDLNVIRAQ